jgi:hypothetical protein
VCDLGKGAGQDPHRGVLFPVKGEGSLMLWDRDTSAQPEAYCTLDGLNLEVEEDITGDQVFSASCNCRSSGGEGDECTIALACTRFNIKISILTWEENGASEESQVHEPWTCLQESAFRLGYPTGATPLTCVHLLRVRNRATTGFHYMLMSPPYESISGGDDEQAIRAHESAYKLVTEAVKLEWNRRLVVLTILMISELTLTHLSQPSRLCWKEMSLTLESVLCSCVHKGDPEVPDHRNVLISDLITMRSGTETSQNSQADALVAAMSTKYGFHLTMTSILVDVDDQALRTSKPLVSYNSTAWEKSFEKPRSTAEVSTFHIIIAILRYQDSTAQTVEVFIQDSTPPRGSDFCSLGAVQLIEPRRALPRSIRQ